MPRTIALQSTGKRSALGTVCEAELYGGVLSSSLSREHIALTAEFLRGDEYVLGPRRLLTFLNSDTTGHISSMSSLPSSPHPSSPAMNSANMCSPLSTRNLQPPPKPLRFTRWSLLTRWLSALALAIHSMRTAMPPATSLQKTSGTYTRRPSATQITWRFSAPAFPRSRSPSSSRQHFHRTKHPQRRPPPLRPPHPRRHTIEARPALRPRMAHRLFSLALAAPRLLQFPHCTRSPHI